MGAWYSTHFGDLPMPDNRAPPTFDPLYGFPEGRPLRKLPSYKDMENAGLKLEYRDYCADKFLKVLKCRRDYYPFFWKRECTLLKADWDHCLVEDGVLRMKEYEREKRLLQREERKRRRKQQQSIA